MRDQIRELLIADVKDPWATAYPNVRLVFDNEPFDWDNLPERFVLFEVEFYDGNQIGMAAAPRTRYAGMVYVSAQARVGLGSKICLQHGDWFGQRLKYRSLGPIRLQAPVPAGSDTFKGYYYEDLKIPFYADET